MCLVKLKYICIMYWSVLLGEKVVLKELIAVFERNIERLLDRHEE